MVHPKKGKKRRIREKTPKREKGMKFEKKKPSETNQMLQGKKNSQSWKKKNAKKGKKKSQKTDSAVVLAKKSFGHKTWKGWRRKGVSRDRSVCWWCGERQINECRKRRVLAVWGRGTDERGDTRKKGKRGTGGLK